MTLASKTLKEICLPSAQHRVNDGSEPKGRRKTVARHARQSYFLSSSIAFSESYVRVSPMETVGDTRREQ